MFFLHTFFFNILDILLFLIIIGYRSLNRIIQDTGESSSSDKMEDNEKMDLPPIFVSKKLLTIQTLNLDFFDDDKVFDKVYEINGNIFHEESFRNDYMTIQEFEIRTNENETVATSSNEDKSDKYLEFTLQECLYGVRVNSNVFLSKNQWNTIMLIDCELYCAVCEILVEDNHIKLPTHKKNLEECKPLKEYGMNIIRHIGKCYHCALCTDVIEKKDINEHLSSTFHQEKMLLVTKCGSDVIFDFISDNRNGSDDNQYERDRLFSFSDASYENESVDGFYEYDFTNNDSNSSTSNNDSKNSYASIAKKPAIAPRYVDHVVSDARLRIKFNTWHMIITPRLNEFYCMVCVGFDHIAQKAKHCLSEVHLDKLSKCKIVEKYKQYFVRQVNDLYYHCGYCNRLQLIIDIEDHIELKHSKKLKNHDETPRSSNNGTPKCEIRRNENNDGKNKNNDVKNKNNDNKNENNENRKENNARDNENALTIYESRNETDAQRLFINNRPYHLYSYIFIYQFFNTFHVSFIAYNTVGRRPNVYVCVACNKTAQEIDMMHHIYSSSHIEILMRISFVPFFGVHLIRFINNWAHCTICNVIFELPFTNAHIMDRTHQWLLQQASGINGIPINYPRFQINPTTPQIVSDTNNPMVLEEIKIEKESKIESKETKMESERNKNENDDKYGNENENRNEIENENEIQNENENGIEDKIKNEIENYIKNENENENKTETSSSEYIYLKFINIFVKVTINSYNSLLGIGDGTCYCFVCLQHVFGPVQEHIDTQKHSENLGLHKFIDKYDKHLLRQGQNLYHCCTCNVIFTKRDLQTHLAWPVSRRDTKKQKRTMKHDFKSGLKQIIVETCKEINLNETKMALDDCGVLDVERKNKIVVNENVVLKLCWDAWQGLRKDKINKHYFCLLCQLENVKDSEIYKHIVEDLHNDLLMKFEVKYYPSLMRKVNERILNCVTCNDKITNEYKVVTNHIDSKKHKKNYKSCVTSINSINKTEPADILYIKKI